MNRNIIFLGPPGSGKGTQSELVSNEFGFYRLATGDLLRDEVENGGESGKRISDLIDEGHMVPDSVIFDIVRAQIAKRDFKRGILFDGFPRNLGQARLLESIEEEFKFSISTVFYFSIEIEDLLARIRGRLICSKCKKIFHEVTQPPRIEGQCDACGAVLIRRHDDENESLVKTRYDEYVAITQPLIQFYKSKVFEVDASQSKFSVYDSVKSVLIRK